MVRFDLQFLLCCCRACLGSPSREEESFYSLLGIDRDATSDEIKRAYKRQSLLMHPDKLAQKGQTVTAADQARFTRMKEAYEVLSDPHKKETYDAIGEKGMKWIDQPLSMDPQEMAFNFANSSILDRAKIFSIFLFLAVAILIQPLLLALQVDGKFGNAKWVAILVPVWLWSAFIAFYHVRVIMMGPIPRPEHIPEEEWEDPLPMKKRISSFVRFLIFLMFEIQVALHLDGNIGYPWFVVFIPIFILEIFNLVKVYPKSRIVIISIHDLETLLGKSLTELSIAEQKEISKRYIVVPPSNDRTYFPAYDMGMHKIRIAKQDLYKTILRLIFVLLLVLQLDDQINLNWWYIFSPFFVASLCACCSQLDELQDVQAYVDEQMNQTMSPMNSETDYGAMEEGNTGENEQRPTNLSEEEQNEMRARFLQSTSSTFKTCVVQAVIIFYICIMVFKISGFRITSFWFISPIVSIVSLLLCCLGCMIFCVSPIEEGEMDMDFSNPTATYYNMDGTVNPYNPSFSTTEPTTSTTPNAVTTESSAENDSLKTFIPVPPLETQGSNHDPIITQNSKDTTPVDLLDVVAIPSDEKAANVMDEQGNTTISNSDIKPSSSEVDDLD